MLSIPIMNDMVTPKTRTDYLDELHRAGADRVFLCPENPFGGEPELTDEMTRLRENLIFFRENGFQVGVWINGLGHGGWSMDPKKQEISQNYVLIRGLDGNSAPDSFCPLGAEYRKMYLDYVRRVAETGTPMIMIDDDFRISLHGTASPACSCELHLKEFNRRAEAAGLKGSYTREELRTQIFTGAPNQLRSIWLGLQGDTLRDFSRDLRAAVDRVDPAIRLGQCACLPTWDTDGTDSIEISRILAGKTKPFLRLIGAPYWVAVRAFGNNGLGSIIDTERMQSAWCSEFSKEAEIFSEGDVYPRPRYKVPSVLVEDFDQVLLAEGELGILKYMLDYGQEPFYETGYIDRHEENRSLRCEIRTMFEGKQTCGIYVHERMHRIEEADCSGYSEADLTTGLIPSSAKFANALSLPTVYRNPQDSQAAIVFGWNALHTETLPAAALRILDFSAAKILAEQGIDTGFLSFSEMEKKPSFEEYPDTGVRGLSGSRIAGESDGRFYLLTLRDGAQVLSLFDGETPSSYYYENACGGRFLVYCFDMDSVDMTSPLITNYYRQEQLVSLLRLKTPGAVPAELLREPMSYVLCRKNEKELAVGIWNLGLEIGLPKKIRIDGSYRKIRFIRSDGSYDGNGTVSIDTPLMPYQFAGFIASLA